MEISVVLADPKRREQNGDWSVSYLSNVMYMSYWYVYISCPKELAVEVSVDEIAVWDLDGV
ncbi:hypothetical protein DPMN_048481 [Dreissena polymorpha]|uniref:Uncharacterized protein n=1 Tax=Dreissena polymorpha TaxID=45954 RepID=A0A9D4DCH5_DREPO|nr:hypothetical protein DPMN_048481 [Dreissena polymorpha]